MARDKWSTRARSAAQKPHVFLVIFVMAIAEGVGATGGFSLFKLVWPDPAEELAVRICLGLFLCCVVAFVWTAYRVAKGLPPINLRLPSASQFLGLPANEVPWVTGIAAFLLAFVIATTVFR